MWEQFNTASMSVCSQMGNDHGKGERKKKKDLAKEGTGLVDDPPLEQSQFENGDLQQKGSEQFQKERSRRRYVIKSLAKQHGTASPDCDNDELNADCQGDVRNGGELNHVSPNEATQSNVVCTVQSGEDQVGTFGDSSLASDCVAGNKSDKVCDDHVAGEHNKATADPELVEPGMNTGDATGNTVSNVPCEVLGDVTTDVQRNAPDDIPANVKEMPGTVRVDVPDDVETFGICAQSGVAPKYALCPNQSVPGMDAAQKKTPTMGDDITSEPVETRSDSISSTQSSHLPPPSKIESSSPTPMQIVSGLNNTKSAKDDVTENVKVTDQLISEVVTNNSLFLEKLSKYLDRESRVIKCWKHLAYVMDVPPEERNQFDVYTEHSPTEDLFNYLTDIWNQDLKVIELKGKLKLIHRNDVIADIEKGGFKDAMKVSDLISGDPKFIKLLSPKLDIESRTIGNWRSLAAEFGIRKQKTEQFGLRGSGPTGALFLYMQTAEGLCDLTMQQLRSHFLEMERKDLVNLLDKQAIQGSWLVKNVLADGSELLSEIGERLNKEIRAVKNWRNLAYRLKIPPETYSSFDTSKEKAKSPTKMMFQWLAKWKPDLNIGDLRKSIKAIDRFDVVEIVTKEAEAALEKLKKQCTFVDGPTEQHTANQALHDLQQMHQDADQRSVNSFNFASNLRQNACDKGFIVSDNPGEGDCMFYALSEQLEFVKGIHLSAAELRQQIVQYLKKNPKLPDGTDLADFTHGYPSWPSYLEKMAKKGTWGDNVILSAAANHFNTPIRVISSLPDREDIIINPHSQVYHGADTLVLGHVHEEHYVSLRLMGSDEGVPRGNPQVLQRYGPDGQYRQQLQGNQQQQERQVDYQSQGHQQTQVYQQRLRDQELQQQRGYQQRQGYLHHPSVQQRHKQRPPLSRDHRIKMKVLDLPKKEVYSKICLKLNIKRDMSFDDFRMLAEELGMDRDTTEYSGQQTNPTDFIFSEYNPDVTVDELVTILDKIERWDVAAVLKDWIQQGSA